MTPEEVVNAFVKALNEEGVLRGLTPEGRATVQLLEMNEPERVRLRLILLQQSWQPG